MVDGVQHLRPLQARMFGVRRYDPSAASTQPADAGAPPASGLEALKARAAAKKAARQAQDVPSQPEPQPPAAAAAAAAAADHDSAPSEPKAKTKAQQRYMKRKLDRRKASKKSSALGQPPSRALTAEELEKKASETPEEKAARKAQAKEAKKARRQMVQAALPPPTRRDDAPNNAQQQQQQQQEEESREERKARRKAEKEAKKQAKALALPMPCADQAGAAQEQPPTPSPAKAPKRRRKSEPVYEQVEQDGDVDVGEKRQKGADQVLQQAQKAQKRARKAAARAQKHKAQDHSDDDDDDDDDDLPAQQQEEARHVEVLDALPVFAKPKPVDKPDAALLATLSTARELQEVHHVNADVSVPFDQLAGVCGLNEKLKKRVQAQSIDSFFAVQTAVLPLLLSPEARHRRLYPWPMRDLCINAPTGSGKTLSYVLPILDLIYANYTSVGAVRKLRALVLLPTKDLVQQLKETLDSLVTGTDIRIGTATGQLSFAKEQAKLSTTGGISPVDILVASPGRLMDHLSDTPDFSLEDLDFFVVDEADRLLAQSFNDWLPPVMDALHEAMGAGQNVRNTSSLLMLPPKRRVQKLLLSATLSRDPVQIAALKLHQPLFVAVSSDPASSSTNNSALEFSLPSTLREHMIVCSSALKPLMLVHIVLEQQMTHGICFTKSTEAATRLVKLLELLQEELASADPSGKAASRPLKVASYSSDLPVSERTRILAAFKAGEISLLICSDLISRGIDIPHVSHVINYDVPVDLRKYVHRVGRTARAGREGDAWSLVESQEAVFFKNLHRQVGRLDKIKRLRLRGEHVEPMTGPYEKALERLKAAFVRQT